MRQGQPGGLQPWGVSVIVDWLVGGSSLVVASYVVWQLFNLWGWHRTVHQRPTPVRPTPDAAVIVPFRNERTHLPRLVESLLSQRTKPRPQLIFVNDHSTDGGEKVLPAEVTVLELADYLHGRQTSAHKKAALTYGIGQTEAGVVVTTDADCYWPEGSLEKLLDHYRSAGTDVVLGPVLIEPAAGFCAGFQALDLAAYQFLTGATAGWGRPVLANGANFSFRRELFLAVDGYAGVDHLPSGDDVLLLHKFQGRSAGAPRTVYAADAAVYTRAVRGWRALWRQRLRWAGKAGEYTNRGLQLAQGLAFLTSLVLLTLLFTLPLHLRPRPLLILWSVKALVDLLCLAVVLRHFGHLRELRWYPLATLFYPFFLVGVGGAALLGLKVGWKGR